jgi:hypothetical protein
MKNPAQTKVAGTTAFKDNEWTKEVAVYNYTPA